jgi:hypothetical protein
VNCTRLSITEFPIKHGFGDSERNRHLLSLRKRGFAD